MSFILNSYSFSRAVLLESLVSYWPLNEASGDAIDAHGSNTLTDTNTVGSAAGKVGNARDFESGSTQYFNIADNADVSTGDIDFTFALWVNLESKGDYRIFIGKDESGQREYLTFYDLASDRFSFSVFTPTQVDVLANTLGSPSTATWYFIVCWHDATANTVNIQVNNGTADSTATGGALSASGTAPFRIGARSTAGSLLPMDGLIDEVGFWKRVLTAPEKTFLYNSGSGRSYSDIQSFT